jgi:hypothetical protein
MKRISVLLVLSLVVLGGNSYAQSTVPAECPTQKASETGTPVMFPARKGLAMGISVPKETFALTERIPVFVWAHNTTDEEKTWETCGIWFGWNIDVYDSNAHRVESREDIRTKQAEAAGKTVMQGCGRNILRRIPPHTCALLDDMGPVNIDIGNKYELRSGIYYVTEKPLTLPMRGLRLTIVEDASAGDSAQRNE